MPDADTEAIARLRIKLASDFQRAGLDVVQSAVVKAGPRAWKTVALFRFVDQATGEIRRHELRFQTYTRTVRSYDFEARAEYTWSCEDGEIEAVREFLNALVPSTGVYRLVEESSLAWRLAATVDGEADEAAAVVSELLAIESVRDAIAASDTAAAASALLTDRRRRAALARLEAVVDDPSSLEAALQKSLNNEWWLFGGRFVGQEERRKYLALDEIDIPLIRSDGSLHIVELKRANIPRLVRPHRSHSIVGDDVHEAVAQVMNYLRRLDENAPAIAQDFKVDVRRSTATIVIGHPKYCPTEAEEIAKTIRTYNAHLSRIDVITYADLLTGARAALEIAATDRGQGRSNLGSVQ